MTILGHHSVGELKDWLAAVDYHIGQIASAYAAFAPTWQVRDAAALSEWSSDWNAFRVRYGAARSRARAAIARGAMEMGVPNSLIPVEDEWQGIQHALSATPGTTAKGDLQDLFNRLGAAQGKPIDVSKTPQPTATDVDLGVYKAADAVIAAGEDAARNVTPSKGTGALLLVGFGLGLGVLLAAKSVLR